MNYNKPPISFKNQVARLKSRGMVIKNEQKAVSYLNNISFYRLRAYTYSFQDNAVPNHPFIKPVTFEQIIDLYVFDRKLRLLVFDVMEKIEIAVRTQIIYNWAMPHGSHWYINPALFRNPVRFANNLNTLQAEIGRSTETFIEHYKNTYTNPSEPPCWMSLEVSSFSLLSLMFQNLKKGPEKTAVANYFGLRDISILENWLHAFCNIRNISAHHERLWNRRLTAHITLPKHPVYPFLQNKNILPYKVYAALCCMQYILNIINPESTFKEKLKDLMNKCPLAQEKEMGFPKNWDKEPLWQ
jgi:abortive infection bacteriophage resistance protein